MASLLAAPDGSLWIGTANNGLLRYRNGGFEKIGGPGLPSTSIRALLVDSRGVLWIGADRGLARLDGGRATSVFTGGWEANVHVLLEYPAGTVWVGANNGLHRFEGGVERVFTTKDGLPDNSIWGLAAGAGGALWVGTHTGGLSEYRQGRFRTYGQRDGFTPTGILALLSDRDGALWIGTDGAGVSRFAEGKVQLLSDPRRALQSGHSMPLRRPRRQRVDGNRRRRHQPLQRISRDHAHHARRASERQRPFRPAGPARATSGSAPPTASPVSGPPEAWWYTARRTGSRATRCCP